MSISAELDKYARALTHDLQGDEKYYLRQRIFIYWETNKSSMYGINEFKSEINFMLSKNIKGQFLYELLKYFYGGKIHPLMANIAKTTQIFIGTGKEYEITNYLIDQSLHPDDFITASKVTIEKYHQLSDQLLSIL
jgi:hypothetical protein